MVKVKTGGMVVMARTNRVYYSELDDGEVDRGGSRGGGRKENECDYAYIFSCRYIAT